MFPVLIPMAGLGPVSIDADDIVRVDRRFGLEPKLFLKDGRTLITTPEAFTSAVTQTDGTGQRSSLARMASADFVQTKGLGLALCSVR